MCVSYYNKLMSWMSFGWIKFPLFNSISVMVKMKENASAGETIKIDIFVIEKKERHFISAKRSVHV